MGLPVLSQPLFETTIPSTEKKVKFRPFTVKEEKLLLIAKESNDVDQAVLSIKQIINNCYQDVDVDKLATFDLEYMLIQLRAKSVSNMVEFAIKDDETDEEIKLELDLDDITVKRDENHKAVFELQDGVYLQMQYPHIEQLKVMAGVESGKEEEAIFNTMMNCIHSVIQGDEVYVLSEFTRKEVEDFIDSLSSKNIQQIKDFFETMPKIRYEKKYTRKDGTEKTFVAEGTETFFI